MFVSRMLCLAVLVSCGGGAATTAPKPAAAKHMFAAGQVSSVKVTGVSDDIGSRLTVLLISRVGQPLDRQKVAEDIQSLWGSALVDDVEALSRTLDDGTTELQYRVKPVPVVRHWHVTGDAEGPEMAAEGTRLDRVGLSGMSEALRDGLREKGHFQADVRVEILEAPENQVDVKVHIEPGPEVRLANINFTGNKALTAARLNEILQLRDSNYRELEIENALLKVTAAYYDRGFVECKVHAPKIEYSEKDQSVTLTVKIDENAMYRLGKITVEGDLEAAEAAYASQTKARSGQVFNRSRIGEDVRRLEEFHARKASRKAEITPRSHLDTQKRIIDVTYELRNAPSN